MASIDRQTAQKARYVFSSCSLTTFPAGHRSAEVPPPPTHTPELSSHSSSSVRWGAVARRQRPPSDPSCGHVLWLVKPLYGVQEIRPRSRTPTWYAAPVVLVTKPGRNGSAATTRVAPAGQRSMFPSWRHAPPRARR